MPAPRLNKSSPLTRGIVFAAAAGYATDLVTGLKGTYIGSMSQGVTRWGQAFESRSSSGNALWFTALFPFSKIKTQHSLLMVMDIDSVIGDARYFNSPRSAFPPHVILADNAGSDVTTTRLLITTTGGSISQFTATGSAARAARLFTRNGTTSTTWSDGVAKTGDTGFSANPVELDDNSYLILFNNEKASTSLGPDGRLFMVALWNRPLTPAQAVMVTLRPDLLLERPFQRGPYRFNRLGFVAAAPAARRRTGLYNVT